MKYAILPALLGALSLMAGCNTTTAEGGENQQIVSRNQSTEIQLTKAGKKQTPVNVLPVTIKYVHDNSYSASPVSTRPKDCIASSPYFKAAFTAPAQLNLPSYGEETPPMTVTCSSERDEVAKTVSVVNLTQQAVQAAAAGHMLFGFGLLGAAITAGHASARDKSKDVWGYPNLVKLN
ncbi:hypothetical protein PXK01_04155 [Phaeobacter sp. PT47_59]|uniref:hypothetical protein n=1 Tax=Phaeobacter sp. PT47_59 TaxID=3029979 RepID=UPI0023809F57|nr:hypothetical protein [Phaeobacter sp. PT47_59]MDE4173335.1 hypothetical protein [Phaeobacter sp. PT47_59]